MRVLLSAAVLAFSLGAAFANDWDDRNSSKWPSAENPMDLKSAGYGFDLKDLTFAQGVIVAVVGEQCLSQFDLAFWGTPGRAAEMTSSIFQYEGIDMPTERRIEIYDRLTVEMRSRFKDPSYEAVLRQTCAKMQAETAAKYQRRIDEQARERKDSAEAERLRRLDAAKTKKTAGDDLTFEEWFGLKEAK